MIRPQYAAVQLALLQLGLRGGEALLAGPKADKELGGSEYDKDLGLSFELNSSDTEAEGVHNAGRMRVLFEDLVRQEKELTADGDFPRSENRHKVKIVVGLFTMNRGPLWSVSGFDWDIRKILRETWLNHPDVCLFPNFGPECTIHVVFVACQGADLSRRDPKFKVQVPSSEVFGSIDWPQEGWENWNEYKKNERDVFLMPINENMNHGKSFEWFRYASRRFPDMDYIAKADTDVFLHVKNVVDMLRPIKENVVLQEDNVGTLVPRTDCEQRGQAFFGKPWTCIGPGWMHCPRRSCGPPLFNDFTTFDDQEPWEAEPCFTYMQGGFYAMTTRMAQNITELDGYFFQNKHGPEDLRTGKAVDEYAHRTNTCVAISEARNFWEDRVYHHLRGKNEHPGYVSETWDRYYNVHVLAQQRPPQQVTEELEEVGPDEEEEMPPEQVA